MNIGNGMKPPTPNGKSRKSSPTLSAGKGFAKLVGGAAIVGLNVTFLGPSAVYFSLWIAGVALFIGGIAEIIGSLSRNHPQQQSLPTNTKDAIVNEKKEMDINKRAFCMTCNAPIHAEAMTCNECGSTQ